MVGGSDIIYNAAWPFRLLKKKMLPTALGKTFSLFWEPIYNLMSQWANLNFDDNGQEKFQGWLCVVKNTYGVCFLEQTYETWQLVCFILGSEGPE